MGTDLFSFKLNYNTKEIGSANALQYNGNISETIWRTANDVSTNKTRAYAYQYDALSRITGADYGIKTTTSFNLASGFDMGIGLYDKNGNIKSLWRDYMANTKIDQLSYTYANAEVSNKLLKVEDSSGSTEGFKNGSTLATEYTYDANGNMKTDANKGIVNIEYNVLNLPEEIDFGSSNKILYFYTADGVKQKKEVYESSVKTSETSYKGSFIYEGTGLAYALFDEGRLMDDEGDYTYEYFLKDHLGNTRVSFTKNGSIQKLQEDHYYPFGMTFQGVNSSVLSPENKYKYNGKELQDDGFDINNDGIVDRKLDLYDYGARFYDVSLGRFHTVDPLAAKFPWQSTYVYADNNPIRYIDVNGMASGDPPWGATYALGLEHAGMSSTQASETMQRAGMIALKTTGAVVGVTALAFTSEIWIPILASGGGKIMTIAELASSSSSSTLILLSIKYPKLYNLIIAAIAAESAPPGAVIPGSQVSKSDLWWKSIKTMLTLDGDTRKLSQEEKREQEKREQEKREQEKKEREKSEQEKKKEDKDLEDRKITESRF